MLTRIYKNYFQNNLFIRIILVFSVIITITISAFSFLMYRNMADAVIEKELDYQRQAMESVQGYLGERYQYVQDIALDIYSNENMASNMAYFLEHPYADYVQHKLDSFFNGVNTMATDVPRYLRTKVQDEPTVEDMLLYSIDQQYLYVYDRYREFLLHSANAAHSFVPDAMNMEDKRLSIPNVWVRKAVRNDDLRLFSFHVPISNKQSWKTMGHLVVYFNADAVATALSRYQEKMNGTILVLTDKGEVVFDSAGVLYGQVIPGFDPLTGLYTAKEVDKDSYITTLPQNSAGFTVMSRVPKSELADSYHSIRNTIIIISTLCILFAILIPALFIMNFAKRANTIIRFTRKVKGGDLKVRIHDDRDDELGQISKSFDDMLEELNLYIDRVLKVEIKQKQTELTALQARINPHFLYNTLEVIRMRAVTQGAEDVGEMIYSLSALFKHYVKPKPVHRLKDELEACRLYLQLFRIRYKDRFSYEIHCPPEFRNKIALQMSLQPIIENYIVHGMRQESVENRIMIAVERGPIGLIATVKDNGIGIGEEQLAHIREGLDKPEAPEGSFGLHSVHERLKLLYGEAYGIEIDSVDGEGTVVSVRFPEMAEEE